ncbi:MAG TPA: Rap1a/Tai family immunity protein [Syntrophales bacterium]|nr:Rap1a/Tai family immunity protein [Syntrophales bacterium]
MKTVAVLLLVVLFAAPVYADVVDDYKIRNAGDLVSLCSRDLSAEDYVAAQNFCHGFAVGAYAYYRGAAAAEPELKIVCFKEPYPERTKVIADFVAWSKANQSFMKDSAVDTFFRFLAGAYPCK